MILTRNALVHLCIIFCSVAFNFGIAIKSNLKFELVQALFRHGARTPTLDEQVEFQPGYTGSHNESTYQPWGLAQLTKQGKTQEYEIGKMLRQRYGDLLSDFYQYEELYAYSSNTERTIASLQLVLAALYPPAAEQKWNDNLAWIPIPMHTIPRSTLKNYKKFIIPKMLNHRSIIINSVLRQISDILGKKVHFRGVYNLYNLFKIQKSLKMPLPEWCIEELFEEIEQAAYFHYDILSYPSTLKRLNGGPMVRRLLENIVSSNSNTKKRKIYLHSAHDSTLHGYLMSHNLTDFDFPDYGSTVLVEKYRDLQNKYYIKLLYWTGEPKQMRVLKLEKCSELCPLEKYSELIKSSLPSDDEMLCLLKNLGTSDLDMILKADFER